jgi:hypothetical protein
MRSCSSSIAAWKRTSAWKRFCIGRSSSRWASDSSTMPWWCAMNERHHGAGRRVLRPRGTREAV